MARNRFFAEWKPYPSAPSGCRSLLRWQKTPGWVGAQVRIGDQPDRLALFSLQAPRLALNLVGPFSIPSGVLQTGDHVAVDLDRENADGTWTVKQILLLAPAEQISPPRWNCEWPLFLSQVKGYFNELGLQEVESPSLVACPGLEPALEPFRTEFEAGTRRTPVFLPTSPEIHLKKALCHGMSDIFEMKVCYRNGEVSKLHQPEFHMLEWYRAYAGLDLVIEDLKGLLAMLSAPSPRVTTFAELFSEYLGVRLTPTTRRDELWQWCQRQDLHPIESDTATDLFHRLWIDKIEPHLQQPTIVRDFPPEQAALARLKTDGWADRFEFFWHGIEIANAFHEVNDPSEQQRRWDQEKMERKRLGRSFLQDDPELLSQMKSNGLPPTGGIALGLERLFMAVNGIHDIRDLRLFPYV